MLHLTVEQARGFYAEHEGRPFFDGLVEFMTSGPIVVSVLEGENAVQRHRDLLGATNPDNALAGTLRADYADSFTENGTHGSDSVESAAREIAFFFAEGEVCRALANLLRFHATALLASFAHPGHIVIYAPGDLRTRRLAVT